MQLAKVDCTWTEFPCYVFVLLTSLILRLSPHVLKYGNDMRKRKDGGEAHVSCSQKEDKILKLCCPRPRPIHSPGSFLASKLSWSVIWKKCMHILTFYGISSQIMHKVYRGRVFLAPFTQGRTYVLLPSTPSPQYRKPNSVFSSLKKFGMCIGQGINFKFYT